MNRLLLGASALCIAGALAVAGPGAAHAAAAEFYKCTLAEDAKMTQLVEATRAFLKETAGEAAMKDYSVRFLTPLYSTDISAGSFYWVGTAPDFAALGAASDFWESDKNADHRKRINEFVSDCEAASAYRLHPVETDGEEG